MARTTKNVVSSSSTVQQSFPSMESVHDSKQVSKRQLGWNAFKNHNSGAFERKTSNMGYWKVRIILRFIFKRYLTPFSILISTRICIFVCPFRSWNGDYLNNTSENMDVHSYRDALKKEGATGVAFSCKTIKFNRHGKVSKI